MFHNNRLNFHFPSEKTQWAPLPPVHEQPKENQLTPQPLENNVTQLPIMPAMFQPPTKVPAKRQRSEKDENFPSAKEIKNENEYQIEFSPAGEKYFPKKQRTQTFSLEESRLIGTGGLGNVYEKKYADKWVAVKTPKAKLLNKESEAMFKAEYEMMKLFSQNLYFVKELAWLQGTGYKCGFVMSIMECSLLSYLQNNQNLQENKRISLALQISHGIKHMHMKGVLHRDIKSENVLIDSFDGRAKISDLGCAVKVSNKEGYYAEKKLVGTHIYMARVILMAAKNKELIVDNEKTEIEATKNDNVAKEKKEKYVLKENIVYSVKTDLHALIAGVLYELIQKGEKLSLFQLTKEFHDKRNVQHYLDKWDEAFDQDSVKVKASLFSYLAPIYLKGIKEDNYSIKSLISDLGKALKKCPPRPGSPTMQPQCS